MARIVIDARIIRSSTGRFIERMLEYLQQVDRKNDYQILLRPADLVYWKPTTQNFQVIEAPFEDFSLGEQIGLNRLLQRLKPDLVHFPMPQQPVLYRGKFVSTIHDLTMLQYSHRKWYELWFTFKRWVFLKVLRRAAHKSLICMTATNYVKNQIVSELGVDPKKIVVVYDAADPLATKPRVYRPLQGKQFIMYVGQATPYKNLARLVDAYALLRPSYPDLQLVFVGKETDWHKRLAGYVASQKVAGVVFTGFMPDEQLAWAYGQAQAYVFPSLSEGFGLPGLEAMQHGCPVLASSASCLPEVYADAALYFDPNSTEDMAEIINRCLSDDGLRKKLVAAGRERVKQFSWKRMAEQTLEVYSRALRR